MHARSTMIYLLFVLLSCGVAMQSYAQAEPPGSEILNLEFIQKLPPFWSVESFSTTEAVNYGNPVEPEWRRRFEANIVLEKDTFKEVGQDILELSKIITQMKKELSHVHFLIPVLRKGEVKTIYGIIISTKNLGSWNNEWQFENSLENSGLPISVYNGQTIVRGTKDEEIFLNEFSKIYENLLEIKLAKRKVELRTLMEEKLIKLEKDLEYEIAKIESSHEARVAELEAEKAETRASGEAALVELRAQHQQQLDQLQAQLNKEISAKEKALSMILKDIEKEHNNKMESLKLQLDNLPNLIELTRAVNEQLSVYHSTEAELSETLSVLNEARTVQAAEAIAVVEQAHPSSVQELLDTVAKAEAEHWLLEPMFDAAVASGGQKRKEALLWDVRSETKSIIDGIFEEVLKGNWSGTVLCRTHNTKKRYGSWKMDVSFENIHEGSGSGVYRWYGLKIGKGERKFIAIIDHRNDNSILIEGINDSADYIGNTGDYHVKLTPELRLSGFWSFSDGCELSLTRSDW